MKISKLINYSTHMCWNGQGTTTTTVLLCSAKQNDPLLIAIFWQLDLLEHTKIWKCKMLSTFSYCQQLWQLFFLDNFLIKKLFFNFILKKGEFLQNILFINYINFKNQNLKKEIKRVFENILKLFYFQL
jgi:hypothetical protein